VEKNPSRVVSAMDDLKMLTPDYNRSVIEKGIELSIRSMHGDKPDEMEVESLMELANKTMSKFPFILPKNLALYLRMASIIEGIYKTHDVDFKFLKVLKNILQQENLITGAYVEELKISFDSFLKSINSTLRVGSDMEKLMNEVEVYMKKRKPVVLISGSIFSSAIFIGSVLLFQSNEYFATIGMISSGIIMGISALLRKY
jgi:predicted unusual protein kinase regulating ubiquinone biosynthesis (AarF/ABC1/UbiB family)